MRHTWKNLTAHRLRNTGLETHCRLGQIDYRKINANYLRTEKLSENKVLKFADDYIRLYTHIYDCQSIKIKNVDFCFIHFLLSRFVCQIFEMINEKFFFKKELYICEKYDGHIKLFPSKFNISQKYKIKCFTRF